MLFNIYNGYHVSSFFVLKFSVDLGAGAASVYLDSMGGSMDSAEFSSIQSKYIIKYDCRWNYIVSRINISFFLRL